METENTNGSKIDLLSLPPAKLEAFVLSIGEKRYRAGQIFRQLHKNNVTSFAGMTDLPETLRETLDERCLIPKLTAVRRLVSAADETEKYLYACADGETLETVLMSYHYGNTVCISTQVGCKMNCAFCASGKAGFVRNLTAGEMAAQLRETEALSDKAIRGLVMMGIGEPLDNFDNVTDFLEIVSHKDGRNMSMRHISLSTCGLVDGIQRLAERKLPLTLSVSLHAVDDKRRSELMPINRRYNIAKLLTACEGYYKATGRRISFEYALIGGVNDSASDAKALARLTKPYGGYVNLIPVNNVSETSFGRSKSVKAFQQALLDSGVTATVRRTLGADINAACGQLRRSGESGTVV
jgi:23S rRNA (adenine2503-C2)-methyltransferase